MEDKSIKWHRLKTWPEMFKLSLAGTKMFEVRVNDRNFCVGDFLLLQEWNPQTERYTGRVLSRQVTYILHGGRFSLPENIVVMQLSFV